MGALDIAKGKAWTSITFTRNTSDFVKAIKDGTIGAGLAGLPGVTPLAGGVVIEAGGSLLGAVGVAGAPGGDRDEACAKAGRLVSGPYKINLNFSMGSRLKKWQFPQLSPKHWHVLKRGKRRGMAD